MTVGSDEKKRLANKSAAAKRSADNTVNASQRLLVQTAAYSTNHAIGLRTIKESIEDVLQQFLSTTGVARHFAFFQHQGFQFRKSCLA